MTKPKPWGANGRIKDAVLRIEPGETLFLDGATVHDVRTILYRLRQQGHSFASHATQFGVHVTNTEKRRP